MSSLNLADTMETRTTDYNHVYQLMNWSPTRGAKDHPSPVVANGGGGSARRRQGWNP